MNNAGTWFLKGAWIELGLERALVDVIAAACLRYPAESGAPLRVLTHRLSVLVRKNETLVFLPLFEHMMRLAHLDTYDDDGLGWLTEAAWVYRSDTMERYLSDLACLKIATPLGQALARRYWQAWYAEGTLPDRHVFYVDMHDKVIWTEQPSPVGYVSALHEVRACLKQAFVHGHGGHALYCQTYPADVHLSEVVVQVALALEHAVGNKIVQVIITDREGLSVEVLTQLAAQNVAFAALLKANQYSGETDFARHSRFRQLKDHRTGEVTHRVAEADFGLTPDLTVRAALMYDVARPDVLIALITTVGREEEPDIRRIVRWYLERWNAQENSFRDQIAFVHLNINFGLRAKHAVPDRRVAKQIADLTTHLAAVTRKLDSKVVQLAHLEQRRHQQSSRHDQQVARLLRPPKRQGPQAAIRAAQREQRLQECQHRYHQRLVKQSTHQVQLENQIETHRQEQARATKQLAQLDPHAQFFEVDTEKDQIMAHLRVGLHNSALWARDHYFSSAYRHTTPLTLWRTFFNQDGFYCETAERITVTLKLFTNPQAQQAAMTACQRFNARRITTLSGKIIEMHVAESI